ncbi:ABC transporter ATP-binding protein [Candidatus Omnitrophota bacterium]
MNISKDFGPTQALKNIDLEVDDGKFFVVLGPSGCGKSTLLNLIAGLEEPSSGKISLGGKDITALGPHKRDIAMVFQSYALYPHLSVFENMAFGLRVRGVKEDRIREKVEEAGRILNIEDKLKSFPASLSGGQRQRVATGRAIVREPKLFLFDEPLSNLDARLRIELRGELIKLHRRLKKTMIYVTHDQVEALILGDVVAVIKDGSIQQISTPKEIYNDPQNMFVAQFVGTPPMNIIECSVERVDGAPCLKKGGLLIKAPGKPSDGLAAHEGSAVYFGVRPSGLVLGEGPLRGEEVFTETIGEDSYAHVRLPGDCEITVKMPEGKVSRPGESVCLGIDHSKEYLFDSSGKRIKV